MSKVKFRNWLTLLLAGWFMLVMVFPALGGERISTLVNDPKAAMTADDQSAAKLADYWTKERMESAKPLPIPEAVAKSPQTQRGELQEPMVGAPGAVKGQLPQSLRTAFTEAASMVAPSPLGSEPAPLNELIYPPPQTTFDVYNILNGTTLSRYPYITVGKVYLTQNGYNYVASGVSIGGRAIITAGHVVSDGKGHWSSNVVFVPGYRDGGKPYGTWSWNRLLAFTAWHSNSDFSRDVGFVVLNNQSGYTISQKVGYLGFAWNYSRNQHWNDIGYPAASPYGGAKQVETQATLASYDMSMLPMTMGIGSDQTPGSSGGPWIKTFYPGTSGACNYVNGLNSYCYTLYPKLIFSPYFDTSVKTLRDLAASY